MTMNHGLTAPKKGQVDQYRNIVCGTGPTVCAGGECCGTDERVTRSTWNSSPLGVYASRVSASEVDLSLG